MLQLAASEEGRLQGAMPRAGRLDVPGVVQHILSRGIERRNIFRDDTDREEFLAGLRGTRQRPRRLALRGRSSAVDARGPGLTWNLTRGIVRTTV